MSLIKRRLLVIVVLLAGCAAKHKPVVPPPTFSLVVPRQCIEEITAGPDTYCRGRDLDHLTCNRVLLTKKVGCEQLDITATEPHEVKK